MALPEAEAQWRALLLAGLVRALVRQAGGTSVRMQAVAAVALVFTKAARLL
jgi:hypothetical protein